MNLDWCNEQEKQQLYRLVTGLKSPFKTGDESITFLTDNGSFTLNAYGDCCSHSWFEHMELPEFPFTITKLETVDIADVTKEDGYGCEERLQTYSLKITTDKGHGDIEMRNSSNGYYGGSFEVDLGDLK